MNLLLLGPQGSGKGTQAKRIAAEYGIAHIATGDMLRAAIAAQTELGKRVQPLYESGRLVPDELMIELIRERLEQDDAAAGFVLDGFPRTMPQARALDEMLREVGRELTAVFVLQLSDEECVARLVRRAEVEGRADDTLEAIRTRLALYHKETEPVVEYYRTQGHVVTIHGDRPIDGVFVEIQQALDHVAVR